MSVSASQIPNTASSSITATVTAIDTNRNALPDVPVTITADNGAIVSAGGTKTDAKGQLTAQLSIGADRSNRLITLTATSGSTVATASAQVVGTRITSTMLPAVIVPGGPGQVQYRVTDQAGSPMAGVDFKVTAGGLTPAEAKGKTGSNGEFTFTYTAPASPGNFQIAAVAGGQTDTQLLQVQAASTVPAVVADITSASVSANPSVVGVNLEGSAANRSEIRALFLGKDNLPIPNVRARFDLADDPNSIGGSFTTGNALLYSDANGIVTTAYVPGTRSSPTNGVTVRVCYGKNDDDPGLDCSDPAQRKTVTLTVTSEPLGVSVGTNEAITVNELTYVKKFIVSVADAAGVAKPNVDLTVSVDLQNYRKGFYLVSGSAWAKQGGLPSGDHAVCPNEDTNRNGVLEADEDQNNSGRLDPGKSDVIVKLLDSKTGADGTATLQIQYAKNFGSWVDVLITVAASGVAGTEGRATYLLSPIPVDAESIKKTDAPPAYVVSPYGTAADCKDKN